MILLWAFVLIWIVLAILVVVIMRKLGHSKKVVLASRTSVVRAEALAEAAEQSADRITGVAETALEQTGKALNVAQEINKVSGQMDELLGYVTTDAAKLDNGKHKKNLRVVGDEEGAA